MNCRKQPRTTKDNVTAVGHDIDGVHCVILLEFETVAGVQGPGC
jgi:hypothetical protein